MAATPVESTARLPRAMINSPFTHRSLLNPAIRCPELCEPSDLYSDSLWEHGLP